MESTPIFPNSPEGFSTETPEKKKSEKKKKRGYEVLLPERREAEAKKIGEALDRSPLFGERKSDATEKEKAELQFLKEPAAATETEAPTEDIGEQETQEITQELAAARKAEVAEELAAAEPGSPEAVEATEVIKELERIAATGELEASELAIETGATEPDEAEPAVAEPPAEFSDEAIIIAQAAESEPDEPQAAVPTGSTPPPGGGSASGGGTPPPRGPAGGAVPPAGSPAPGPIPRPAAPNSAPNPNLYTSADVAYYERAGQNRGLLVGGIIGYLIGRRRGRIKTEKRLLPIQNRLEKQVKAIESQLVAKEMAVRQLVRERSPQPVRSERIAPLPRTVAESLSAERPRSRLGLEKPARAERLGKAMVEAQTKNLEVRPEVSVAPERVKSMSRSELLELSEKVVVEGASLRQIYESHLIGEKGLRRLVGEYLQGKDIRKDLRREMVEREIDFERDPILRDKAYQEAEASGASPTLKQMLQKVGASTLPDDALASVTRLQDEARAVRRKQQRRRTLLDTAMVTLIVALATAVTILLLRR